MSNKKSVIIVVVLVAVLTGVYFFLEKKFGSKYDWYQTYEQESKEPYGTYIISGLLKSYYPNYTFTSIKKPLDEELKKRKDTCSINYVFIGADMYVDSNDVEKLLDFVEKGNHAFIASGYFPYELIDRFYYDDSLESNCIGFPVQLDSAVRLNFFQPSLKGTYDYSFMYRNRISRYRWDYLKPDSCGIEVQNLVCLGYMEDEKINFFKMDYGKGSVYFHTTPLAFTNYFLLKPAGMDYASKVFSFLPPGNIIWDEYSKIPSDDFNSNPGLSKSPLKFILSEESLRWAWYIFLVLVFIYLIFGMKRRQKIIPLLLPKVNTSLDYVNTVGLMFFQQDAHRTISLYKMKMFLAFIRNRYFIPTNKINEELKKRIAENSSIPLEDVENIFLEFTLIEASQEISKNELIIFHNLLTTFYKKCK